MSVARRAAPSRRRRAGVAFLLAAATFLAVAPARALDGEAVIARWAEDLRATGLRVGWGALARTAAEDRLELAGLEIAGDGADGSAWSLRAPTVVFVGLATRAEGGFVARAIDVPRLDLGRDDGSLRLEATGIEQRDLVVPGPARPAFDPDHPLAAFWTASRLFDPLAAGRVSIARVIARIGGGDATQVTVDGLSLDGLAAARLDRLRLAGLRVETTGTTPARLDLGETVIEGGDFGALRHVFDDAEYRDERGDGLWRQVVGRFEIGPFAFVAGAARLSFARWSSAGRHLRQFDAPRGLAFDRAVRDGEFDLFDLGLALHAAGRSDGWSLERLRLSGPDLDHAAIDRIDVGAFDATRLADLTIEGCEIVATDARLRLGRLAIADLRPPDPADLRRALRAAAVGAAIDPSSLMPTLARLRLEEVEIGDATSPGVRLAAFVADFDRFVRAVPTSIAVAATHLVVPAGFADEEGRAILARLGYDRLDVSAAARLAWSEPTRELVADAVSVEIAEAGRLDLGARLTEVPPTLFVRPDTAAAILPDVRLAEARLAWTDASLFDRLLKMAAEDEGVSPARLRRRLANGISPFFAEIRDAERRRRIVDAVRRFVQDPKTLTFVAAPATPLSVSEIVSGADQPARLVERMGTTVSAGRPGRAVGP